MRTSCEKSKSGNMRKPLLSPQPGEIWQLNRHLRFSEEFSLNQDNQLFSIEAKSFLEGDAPPRYVMIVTEPEVDIISVMVLSAETDFISDIDLVIPSHITGLAQDLLAETWHVQPMLIFNLLHSVGKRLSRDIYDRLLNVGDYYHGLVNQQSEINDIEELGLNVGKRNTLDVAEIALFHQRETAWSDVLIIPVAVHNTYIKSVSLTDKIISHSLQIEQELIEFQFNQNIVINSLSNSFNQTQIILSRWWKNIFEPEWQAFSTSPNLVIATRSHNNSQNIEQDVPLLIQQLSPENDESQRQRAAKQLGEIAVGNSDVVQALVNLLRSTSDDETLWVAVESLRKIDPENPAAGIQRVRLIDLGMEIAGKTVALAVGLLQKFEGDVSVLLQVYPTANDDYLPADLKLRLQDDSGNILREITARRADVYMQLKFSCEVGERFSVQVSLNNAHFSEYFVI
ncbi:DUF1822 family protein [Calothrix sp. UHCC 0171]|uniref:DUF1822 family protein n=1 Tax=Calothrix sp. UHCC 0171 TaxID=3110245 RepID=UPI002B209292|nr:DUF1822 family protein [Calothrix sp. UHCC 0171]MEA5571104.1 DUF1822 family protein [Calothrix sp. UHCC 0171]